MLLLDRLDEEYVTGGPTVRTLSDAGKSPERLSYLISFPSVSMKVSYIFCRAFSASGVFYDRLLFESDTE